MHQNILNHLNQLEREIEVLYGKDVEDYRGRRVTSQSVSRYLSTERDRFVEVITECTRQFSKTDRILDVGIAYGFIPVTLGQLGWCCEGLETVENIPIYCALAQKHGIQIHEGKLGIDPLKFDAGSWDGVILSEVFEHLRLSPSLVFGELNRILKPGGKLFLTTPNFTRLTNVLKMFAGRNPLESFPDGVRTDNITEYLTHIREYTLTELKNLAEKNDFRVNQAWWSDCMERGRFHHWITRWVPPWRGDLMLIAEKK